MVVQLSIPVADVDALLALDYTRIEVWRSADEGNSYQEITGGSAAAAIFPSLPPATAYRIGGKQIRLTVDEGVEYSIDFSVVTEFWTATQVRNRINEVVSGLASVVGGLVVLTSGTTGRASSVRITYTDAVELFPSVGIVYGLNARPTLVSGTLIYAFSDVAGISTYRYKWRFSQNGAGPISEFSERVYGSAAPLGGVPIAMCTATFVGIDGRPQKRRIVIVSDSSPSLIGGIVVGSELPNVVDTDDLGFLQVPLVQGVPVRVAIEGTAFVREFTVPAQASFDLLQVMAAAPDPFTVQVPLPFLIRRSI
jgi:hypothetical protein